MKSGRFLSGIDTMENDMDFSEDRQNDGFIQLMVEMLCLGGILLFMMLAGSIDDSIPNAGIFCVAFAIALGGFLSERSMLLSQAPSKITRNMYWVGPVFITGLMLILAAIDTLFMEISVGYVTDLMLFIAFFFVFWIIGAGIKRLVLRGRFYEEYRGIAEKAKDLSVTFYWKGFLVLLIIGIIMNGYIFVFDNEDFQSVLGSTIVVLLLVGFRSRSE